MSEIQNTNNNEELLTFDSVSPGDISEISDPVLAMDIEEKENEVPNDYIAHRKVYPNSFNGSRFVWTTPFIKSSPEIEFSEFPNVNKKSLYGEEIIGLVGMFIDVSFGFVYWGSKEDQRKNENRPICKTVAAHTHYRGKDELIVDNMPLKKPVRQPYQAKTKPGTFSQDLRRLKSRLTLYGSRAPLDENGNVVETEYDSSEPITLENVDKRFRTCESCVFFHDHFKGQADPEDGIPSESAKCGFNGEFKFVVFAVAIQEKDADENKQVVFYEPGDLGIETLTGPFVARCTLNKSTGLNEVGQGRYEISINSQTNPLYDDKFTSFSKYYEFLEKSRERHAVVGKEDDKKVVYNAVTMITPVEVEKDDPNEGGADYIPMFRHLGGGNLFDHCLISENLAQFAYDLEQAEIQMANGQPVTIPSKNPIYEVLKQSGYNCFDSEGEEPQQPQQPQQPQNNGNGNGASNSPKKVEEEEGDKGESNPFAQKRINKRFARSRNE
jgi:hypothetical protein